MTEVKDEAPVLGPVKTLDIAADALEFLSESKRQLGLRIVPWNTVAMSQYGPIMFEPGAFGEVDPAAVRLRMDHVDPPTGLGASYENKPDAAYMAFQVSRTERGNEQLTLAKDGVSTGASVGFQEVLGKPEFRKIDGQRVTVYPPDSAVLAEVSTTWKPTFADAGVTYMLAKEEPVANDDAGNAGQVQAPPPVQMLAPDTRHFDSQVDKVLSAFDEWHEAERKRVTAPALQAEPDRPKPTMHGWVQTALQLMRGQAISPAQLKSLALDDVITSDNPGLVPEVLVRDFDALIRLGRPFIESLRQVAPPSTGMTLILPYLLARAGTGTQSQEKADITGTTAPKVGTVTFPYEQVFGGADVAIQMLNRGDASFFDLLSQLLGEAYSLDAEGKAIDALLNPQGSISGGGTIDAPQDGGVLDPEDPHFGLAWENSIAVYRRAPDTIWLNAAATAAFIDAKAPLTNAPLYSNLAAAFTAGNGPGGLISGLRPVYVPALDGAEVDAIVGPARSYVYAEDPQRTLQVDVPSKAGRDIALVGGFFFGPVYAPAFTTYTVESSS